MPSTELVKALVSPLDKLITTISNGIGKAYEPIHVRRMADAEAYRINKISEAVRDNIDIPLDLKDSELSIDTANADVVQRAVNRLKYQEILKQQNIESVINNAADELKNTEEVSETPVNPDWVIRFFNSVEDISDNEMQLLWGRILAGEVKQPGAFSLRTLEKLRNMTADEAKIFKKLSSYALSDINSNILLHDDFLNSKYNIVFNEIIRMEECGLINSAQLAVNFNVKPKMTMLFYNKKVVGMAISSRKQILSIPVFTFTQSGNQLVKIVQDYVSEEYIIDCLSYIKKQFKGCSITAHHIEKIENGVFSYKQPDLLP